MLVGYARVSTVDQDPEYQLQALREHGCERIFEDRCRGSQRDRPQLQAALDLLRREDALVVWKFDRLARSLRNLIELGLELEQRGSQLVSLTENVDTATPGGRLVFAIFGAMAQFEADLASERTREAYKARKGVQDAWGRPSPFRDPKNVRIAKSLLADLSIPRTEIAKRFGVHRNTLYAWFPGGDPEGYTGRAHRRAP